ncbi:Uma2 family endonuclease [Alkalinema sp. FACHB-956]|uniref:Uma2 family endonuclease n=1 Tax=Alkalinema sp. FACHB-956 TaxID=2692768 RepID=UPI00168516ED|nr:Uma2 family endonuclease [Alkalinema sp. FACHB-956]MBD2325522.1 Uma2 family endonuclease [Alkalinema sp. FACHB-956]
MVLATDKTAINNESYTAEQYLELEVSAETRSEYWNGEIVPMSGGTPTHNKISSNMNGLLWLGLKGKPYDLFIADQRLAIPDRNIYAYPDIMILPRPIELQAGRKDTVINPILIAEVLSDSTEAYDRNKKFSAYRTISTFQEYVLIDQYQPHVEHYVKQGSHQWLFTEYDGLDQQIMLTSISVEISLVDLYENVVFE